MAKDVDKLKAKLKLMQEDKYWSVYHTIKRFLTNIKIDFIEDYIMFPAGLQFDFYIPANSCAITILEVNKANEQYLASYGLSKYECKLMYHQKAMKCKELGVRHIFIWDYQWNNDKQKAVLQSIIKNAVSLPDKIFMARKTAIHVERAYDVKDFFQKNNINGYRVAKDAICLSDKDSGELLMAYAIGHAYFGKGKYDLEIARGACKLGYHVIGGTSKLWKYIAETYAPDKSIVYYVDLNQFNGHSLDKLCEQFPDMKYVSAKYSFKNWFVDEQKMKNRDPMHHSEVQNLVREGKVLTCWDAGSLVYVFRGN